MISGIRENGSGDFGGDVRWERNRPFSSRNRVGRCLFLWVRVVRAGDRR